MNGVQFVWNHRRISMISDQNCKTRSSITILLQPFWNRKIQSLRYRMFLSGQMFYWSSGELVYRKLIKLFLVSCNLIGLFKQAIFCCIFNRVSSLAGEKMRSRTKHSAIYSKTWCDSWMNCTSESQSDNKVHQLFPNECNKPINGRVYQLIN